MASIAKLYFICAAFIFFYAKIFFTIYRADNTKIEEVMEVSGEIDQNCVTVEELKNINENTYDVLQQLRKTSFFKIFKVRLDTECPFWQQNFACDSRGCATQECRADEVPYEWKNRDHQPTQTKFKACPFSEPVSTPVNPIIEEPYQEWSSGGSDSWFVDEQFDENAIYVNLQNNIEANTGYQGRDIWKLIYEENCLTMNKGACKEEELLYKVISGIHASINTHIAKNFLELGTQYANNHTLFYERVGAHQDRLTNLYFTYSLMLRQDGVNYFRALNRMHQFYQDYEFETGNLNEDIFTKQLINLLLERSLGRCEEPFKESTFFTTQEQAYLKQQFRSYFFNITRIFDCISCERCKLHGKLQITGVGSALKVLFADNPSKKTTLNRNEIIAFVNTLGKLSKSIYIIEEMKGHQHYINQERGRMRFLLSIILGCSFLVSVFIMKCCIEKQKERNEQRKEAGLRVGELDDLVEEDEINHMDKMTQEEIGEFLDKRFDKIFKED